MKITQTNETLQRIELLEHLGGVGTPSRFELLVQLTGGGAAIIIEDGAMGVSVARKLHELADVLGEGIVSRSAPAPAASSVRSQTGDAREVK